MSEKPLIIVSVTNDLSSDQRVNRSCTTLVKQGFRVILAGRVLPSSSPMEPRSYETRRFRLWFNKGPLFYANYNLRLLIFLLSKKVNVLFANDLDTLPANFIASRIKNVPLVYDTHEFYTGVPELENRPAIRKIWESIEKLIFPSLEIIMTVNDSIAGIYEKKYGKKLVVIRNVPMTPPRGMYDQDKNKLREELGLPRDKKIVILQGAGINIDRGAEEAVEAMRYLDDTLLVILGGGDVLPALSALSGKYNLDEKILFLPRMPYNVMMGYTKAADLGLTLDKDTNINYRFSLPNKLFDYIHAGIPVLASRLAEVEKIIRMYEVGDFISNHDPEHIARRIKFMLSDQVRTGQWKINLKAAASQLNWEHEEKKFPDLINESR